MLTLLKIGGNVLNHPATLAEALDHFAGLPHPKVLVHGGGRRASEVSTAMGRTPTMIGGRRITDAPTLEIVTMVYAGEINKKIVAGLQARGGNAIGLSGADGNVVQSVKRPVGAIDYGFAGNVVSVNADLLTDLLDLGLRPVLCPVTHDRAGQLLNTNADTIANETAVALAKTGHEVSLQYCFELPGVLRNFNDKASAIPKITPVTYASLRADGTVCGGMLPKLDNAFAAVAAGVKEVIIGDVKALAMKTATVCVPDSGVPSGR